MANVTAPIYTATEFLYQNVDFTSLNWFELKWAQWYLLFKVRPLSLTSVCDKLTFSTFSGPVYRHRRHVVPSS